MKTSDTYSEKPDGYKSPEKLEQEVNATRARIGDRLETLSSRLSPGDMLDQVLGVAREHGGEFTHNLTVQLKNNPVPLVLTGIGLAWLMLGSANNTGGYSSRRRGYDDDDDSLRYGDENSEYPYDTYASAGEGAEHAQGYDGDSGDEPGLVDKAKDVMGKVSDEADQLKRSARGKMQHASEAVHQRMRSARRNMGSTRQMARQNMRTAQESMTDFLEQQPVLAASLGVALGAAIGALLPETEMEERVMGSASEEVMNKARSVAGDQYDKVRESAKEMVQKTRQVMQGSTDS